MGKAASALAALEQGGPRELVRRTRSWGSRVLDPEPPAPAAPPRPAAPTATASNVGFAEATRFFKRRQANYEKLADAIEPYLDPDGVLFDIGANIGYFSKVVGERTKFRGAAHLFEPIPHLAQFCFKSLEDADFSFSVHLFGLSDSDGHVDIFIDTKGNFGWNTMIGERAQDMTPQRIAIRRFDGIGLNVVPSVVKIDVEGAEYLVLRGLLPAIRSWDEKPPILCEIGWGAGGHPAWDEELSVLNELLSLGYRTTTLEGEPIELATIDKTCDVMFLPERFG